MSAATIGPAVEGVVVEVRGPVLELTLDRPARRNALTPELIEGLLGILDEASGNNDVRAVLLTGAGDRAFCAGFDIGRIESPGGQEGGNERDLVDDLATVVRELPLPVIAAVNGAAVGAGCDLAVACDIRIGVPTARFGMPPARLGLLYGWKGVDRLVRTVGLPAAKEMLLTGRLYDAQRAYDVGLLSAIIPADDLLTEARELTDTIASNAPLSVAGSKRMVDVLASRSSVTDEELDEFAAIQERVWASEDATEGARAYREGRQPRFKGR
ncbi:MAG: enoyl-CoA hydratase/isomerase family protein [Actinobacteria bacterium]|nr:enoyl-CoA hydratase/isomerase family protein [Actinomycetota bacterium]